eukprot:1939170-Prymnesium_polylepis.2
MDAHDASHAGGPASASSINMHVDGTEVDSHLAVLEEETSMLQGEELMQALCSHLSRPQSDNERRSVLIHAANRLSDDASIRSTGRMPTVDAYDRSPTGEGVPSAPRFLGPRDFSLPLAGVTANARPAQRPPP